MATSGRIRMRRIKKMLKECAPSHTIQPTTHYQWVQYNGKTYPLPRGQHGKRDNPEIEKGHVKQMVRLFKLDAERAEKILGFPISNDPPPD